MATTICIDCRNKVSDRAMWCVRCGKPFYVNILRTLIYVYLLWLLLCLIIAVGVWMILLANGVKTPIWIGK